MPDTISVRLPQADPAVYLEWMAYWRDIERRMIERPALEAFASRESAPFLRDPISDWISDTMAGGGIPPAGAPPPPGGGGARGGGGAPRRGGADVVAPQITGDALVLRQAMKHIAARAE